MQIESILEHGTGVMNEDFLIIEGNLFGVFDGATSLNAVTYEYGYTGGFLASHLAGEAFRENNGTMADLSKMANTAIRQAMKERGVNLSDKGNLWSTSAAVVRIHDKTLEWAHIGDCMILLLRDNGSFEILCEGANHDEETLNIWKEVGQRTDDPIHVALHDQIFKVRSGMNVQYGVFSGEPEAMDFLNVGMCAIPDVRHVLLFTDGFFPPHTEPNTRRDFSMHVELFYQGGLKAIRDSIRYIESEDSGCRIYPRFKPHDDIAAIAVSL